MNNIAATRFENRIVSLDILRGFAILGILIMNIVSFSTISASYSNPFAEGTIEGVDKWAFIFGEVFANHKFMSLFSILFGASILLITQKIEDKGKSATKTHFLRNMWLLLFGLIHAYVLWYGDILVSYALCSVWLYWFRKKSAKALLVVSIIFFLIGCFLIYLQGVSLPYWPKEFLQEARTSWQPQAEVISSEKQAYLGSWLQQQPHRIDTAQKLQSYVFLMGNGWHITSLMLLGMALLKLKILTAQKSIRFYKGMSFFGFGIGLTLGALGLIINYNNGWTYEFSMFQGSLYNLLGSIPMAMGYIGLVMLLAKSKYYNVIQNWIAPIGKMALTNYLLQSIIATLLFYGYGFGLFSKVNRAELWGFILIIWTIQILYSSWWLSKFKLGPFEWLWRSLTIGKIQTFKR